MGIVLKPFAWLLLFFYDFTSSYGLALILFAFVIKMILFPVTLKSKKSMIQTSMLSGRMQQLQKQYGKDKERYNMEVQKMYDREKVNPMGGCLWSIIPMVLLIGLYYIIREPLVYMMDVPKDMLTQVALLTGVENAGAFPQIAMAHALNDASIFSSVEAALSGTSAKLVPMDFTFLGMNLSSVPNWKFWDGGITVSSVGLFILPLVSTVVSFLSMKVSMATNKITQQSQNDQMDRTNKTMMYTMPLMSLWIGFTMPAGMCLYWIAQYVVSMGQELVCSKLLKKDYEAARVATEERERLEKEEEKRRKETARLERARRIEEEKKNKGKKKPGQKKNNSDEPEQDGVKKIDSREGLRAYARGRAYVPGRFDGVTPYIDPNQLFAQEAAALAASKGKKGTQVAPAQESAAQDQQLTAPMEQEIVEDITAAPVELPVQNDPATTPELVEVEMEEIEVEVDEDEDQEGV